MLLVHDASEDTRMHWIACIIHMPNDVSDTDIDMADTVVVAEVKIEMKQNWRCFIQDATY